MVEAAIQWNYTTYLNIIFLALTAMLVIRFMRTGGPKMFKMRERPMNNSHRMSHG